MTLALEIVMWVSLGLLAYAQVGYGLLLAGLARVLRPPPAASTPPVPAVRAGTDAPRVSLIVAAHDEERMIAGKVTNALALEYPREALEVIVCCDGCADGTAARAREAGADLVLELGRVGKVRAQDAGVERARGEIVAFSDANASLEPGALRALVAAFADPRVGYACGQVHFTRPAPPAPSAGARVAEGPIPTGGRGSDNQEGLYWRYELALRTLESRLASITAGNGALYATRREAYLVVDAVMGHDLSFPFNLVQRGWRAVYVPSALAREKMVPTIEGEFARKRRMMSHTWPIVVRGGMLRLGAYRPLYALMIISHRLLRYASPGLHLLALAANAALLGQGTPYVVVFGLQVALLAGAALARVLPLRPLLVARYYVLTTASSAAGLWDWLRRGTPAGWEAAEGTR